MNLGANTLGRTTGASDKVMDSGHDNLLLLEGKCGIHGQGKDLTCGALRNRQISLHIAEVSIGILEVQRNWIVDAGLNSNCLEGIPQSIAFSRANDVEVVYGF